MALSTPRLILNPLTSQDAFDLFAVRGDPEIMACWDWPADASLAVTATIVQQMLREMASGDAHYWTVRLRSEARFVGLCDLSDVQAHASADIGFMLARRSELHSCPHSQ